MADNTPLYNLKAVTNEVGLNPATLRAWERRYDLLKPKRSPGGHRLYSRQDIELLKWLIARQKEGLNISSAVEMWKYQQENYQDISRHPLAPMPETSTGETILDELRDQWLSACLVFDDQAANRTLDQAFVVASPEMILSEVLQKGLSQIGERWYAGSASVQQEHFASAIAIRRINALLAGAASPTRTGHILAACPPGEEHDFVLLMITYLLRRRGWDVIYLGSNVPLMDLNATIQSTAPVLILSAAQTLTTAVSLRILSEYLITQDVPLAYGGGIFNQLPAATQCISGYFLGTEVAMVPQMVERLVTAPPPMPTAPRVSREYSQTLAIFLENEATISKYVTSKMKAEPINPAHMEVAITNLSRLIASALTLGDINYTDHSITWLNGLIKNYGLSTARVMQFYAVYRQGVEQSLAENGLIIQDALAKYELSA